MISKSDIFSYTDYRKFLSDYYALCKAQNPHFSHRYIANHAGFRSSGFFAQVLQGKSNISDSLILGFAKAFKLSVREAEYFELMVRYNQSKSLENKKHFFEKMLSFKGPLSKAINPDQYEYFDKWYYVAIRELLNFFPFFGDYKDLARCLVPQITPTEARNAVELLLRLNFLRQDEKGRYVLTDTMITTGMPGETVEINNFQAKMLQLSMEAIDRFPREERSISTLTLSMSKESFKEVEEKLSQCRREIMDIVQKDANRAERVYQYNLQIFPLTQPLEDQNEK